MLNSSGLMKKHIYKE